MRTLRILPFLSAIFMSFGVLSFALDVDGRTVESIRFEADGPIPGVSDEELLALSGLRVGAPLTNASLQAALRQLYASRFFQDIQIFASQTPTGGVDLRVSFFRRYLIRRIGFKGKKIFNDSQLRRNINVRIDQTFNKRDIQSSVEQLREYYRSGGFPEASIEPTLQVLDQESSVNLVFRIDPGDPLLVSFIRQEYPDSLKPPIDRLLNTRQGKRFSEEVVLADVERLRTWTVRQGYLSAFVRFSPQETQSEAGRVALELEIVPGPHTEIRYEGFPRDHDWTEELPLYEERTLSSQVLEESKHELIDLLQGKGYLEADVSYSTVSSTAGEISQVVFQADPGRRMEVDEIVFEGNTIFQAEDLSKTLETRAGGWIGRGRFTAEAASSDVLRIQEHYYRSGYLQTQVTYRLLTGQGGARLIYTIHEGDPARLEGVTLQGNNAVTRADLQKLLQSRAGGVFSPTTVAEDRSVLLAHYENQGFRQVDIQTEVSEVESNRYRVAFLIQEGSKFLVDQVILSGNKQTRTPILRKRVYLQSDDPLSLERELLTESKLYELAVFNRVELREIDTSEHRKSVLVHVDEAKRFSLVYGAGYSSFEGVRGTAGLIDNNFRGLGSPLSLRVRGSKQRQRGSLSYPLPRLRDARFPTLLSISADNEEVLKTKVGDKTFALNGKPFSSLRLNFSSQSEKQLSRRESLFFRYELERVRTRVPPDLEVILEFFRQEPDLRLSSFALSYLNDSRDSSSEPQQGFFLSGETKVSSRALGSQEEFFRFLAGAQYYHPFSRRLTWVNSLRLGLLQPFGRSDLVPISERFFSGGATSIRGLPQNLAGPLARDPETGEVILVDENGSPSPDGRPVPLGGNALAIFNSEFRLRLAGRLSSTFFYDLGNVFERISDFWTGGYANTIGLGLHIATPIGPIRFDAGYNPSPPDLPGFSSWNFHFILGHPF